MEEFAALVIIIPALAIEIIVFVDIQFMRVHVRYHNSLLAIGDLPNLFEIRMVNISPAVFYNSYTRVRPAQKWKQSDEEEKFFHGQKFRSQKLSNSS